MLTIFNFLGGVKGVIFSIIFALAIACIFLQKHDLNETIKQRDIAINEKVEIQSQLDKAIDVAKNNSVTIELLKGEKKQIQDALDLRDSDKLKNQQKINKTNEMIDNQTSNPDNRKSLSPVLKSTLAALQEERKERRAQKVIK